MKLINVSNKINDIKELLININKEYNENIALISYIDGEYGCRVLLYRSLVTDFINKQKTNNNITTVGISFKGNKFFLNELCDIVIEIDGTDFFDDNNINNSYLASSDFEVLNKSYSGNDGWNLYYIRGIYNNNYENILQNLNLNNIFYTTHHDGSRIINNINYRYCNSTYRMIIAKYNGSDLYYNLNDDIPQLLKPNMSATNTINNNIVIWIRNTNKWPSRNMPPEIYNTLFMYCITNKKHLYVFMDLIPVEYPDNEYIHICDFRENNIPMFDKFVEVCNNAYIYVGVDSGSSEIAITYTNVNIICYSMSNLMKLSRPVFHVPNSDELISTLNNLYNK